MEISILKGRHDPLVERLFDHHDIDAFLRADLLTAEFEADWYSVLVTEGSAAMLHSFTPCPIGETGYQDIEAWFGYSGPVVKGSDPTFAPRAFRAYSEECRRRGIVAELIRFNPIRQNHLAFHELPGVELIEGRWIAYVPLRSGDQAQMALYSAPCQRQIKAGRRRYRFGRVKPNPEAWDEFIGLYASSLSRVGAARRWYFDAPFFERMRQCPAVSLWGVFAEEGGRDRLVSAALVVAGSDTGYALLVANDDLRKYKSANDLLTHGIAQALEAEGYRLLCLGGGRSSAEDDSLWLFKRKFSAGHVRRLPVGLVAHEPGVLEDLYRRASQEGVVDRQMQPSTELIAQFMRYRLAPSLSKPEALT